MKIDSHKLIGFNHLGAYLATVREHIKRALPSKPELKSQLDIVVTARELLRNGDPPVDKLGAVITSLDTVPAALRAAKLKDFQLPIDWLVLVVCTLNHKLNDLQASTSARPQSATPASGNTAATKRAPTPTAGAKPKSPKAADPPAAEQPATTADDIDLADMFADEEPGPTNP